MAIPAPPPLPPVTGHRGAKGHAPENTLAGIRKGVELGARWIEFDVKLTADHELVVMHDDTVNRTTDGRGAVAGMTLAELRALDAGRWFSPDFAGEPIPTLAEVMDYLVARGIGANVEVKACTGREAETGAAVARALAARWFDGPVPILLSSFSAQSLGAARQAAPQVPRGLLTLKFPNDWVARMRELGCATFHVLDRRLTEARVRAVREAGFRPLSYTVNDPGRARDLLSWGLESVITDYPDRVLRAIG
jgi:glycerophosphoryl diester phosphodiesterase